MFRALALLVALLPLVAVAEPAPTVAPAETVKVKVLDSTVELGNLHVFALPVAPVLSGQASIAAVLSAHLQLGENLGFHASVTVPWLGLDGDPSDTQWFRAELGGALYRQSEAVEDEKITLTYDSRTQTYRTTSGVGVRETTTNETSVQVPALNRNWGGWGGGLIVRGNESRVVLPGRDFERPTQSLHLTPYVGISAMNAMALTVDVEGYGQLSNNRWLTGGVDLLFDAVRSYDVEPSEAPGRFGLRIWGETAFAKKLGLAGRLEVAYYPGGAGVTILAAFGGALNTTVDVPIGK